MIFLLYKFTNKYIFTTQNLLNSHLNPSSIPSPLPPASHVVFHPFETLSFLLAENVDEYDAQEHVEHPIAHQQSKIPPPVVHVPIQHGGEVLPSRIELAVLAQLGSHGLRVVDIPIWRKKRKRGRERNGKKRKGRGDIAYPVA